MKAGTYAYFLPMRLSVGLGPESMYTFTSKHNNMQLSNPAQGSRIDPLCKSKVNYNPKSHCCAIVNKVNVSESIMTSSLLCVEGWQGDALFATTRPAQLLNQLKPLKIAFCV